MMSKLNNFMIRITLIVLLLTGCGNISNQDKGSTYTFEFEVSNNDSLKFGRKEYNETGEIFSIKSLCRKDNIVYLVDPVYNNVKAVDLKTGKVRVSESLVSKKAIINDIAIHGERILVSTDEDVIYVLNFSLSIIDVKRINRDVGSKVFLRNGENLYIFSDPADVDQDTNFDISINAIRIDKNINLVEDTLHTGRGLNSLAKIQKGYELTNNRRCLQSTKFQLCLDEDFPAMEYFCRNIFVNENSVSFFEFRNNKFRVVSVEVL